MFPFYLFIFQDLCDRLLIAKAAHLMLWSPGISSVALHTYLPGYIKLEPRTHLHILQLFSPLTEKNDKGKSEEDDEVGKTDMEQRMF